jgi:hypothetical protein
MRDFKALTKLLPKAETAHTETPTVLVIKTPRGLWNPRAQQRVHMKWLG